MDTKWDVIVSGGGTAGLFAGIASAREGAKTLLVERSGYLGGNMGVGMNVAGFFDGQDRQVVRGIPQEFVERVVKMGGGRGHIFYNGKHRWISGTTSVDPEIVKHIAFEMVQESGCRACLYTPLIRGLRTGSSVRATELLTKLGVVEVEGTVFVDCSGDADLIHSVGAAYEQGGGPRRQAVTCMFRVANIDQAAFEKYMAEEINTEQREPWTFENASLYGGYKYWRPWKHFPDVAKRFPKLFLVYYHGKPGDIVINCTHTAIESLEPEEITAGIMRLRRQAVEISQFLVDHVPGCEAAYLSYVYDLGIRESRRIIGDYTLTLEDMNSQRHFDDVVCIGAHPPALHTADSGEILIHSKGWRMATKEEDLPAEEARLFNPAYEIPLRCLLPRELDNVVVAGRCFSSTFEANSGARGMGPCSAMGQAAGTAAALAATTGTPLRRFDIRLLQNTLRRNGAYLGDDVACSAS